MVEHVQDGKLVELEISVHGWFLLHFPFVLTMTVLSKIHRDENKTSQNIQDLTLLDRVKKKLTKNTHTDTQTHIYKILSATNSMLFNENGALLATEIFRILKTLIFPSLSCGQDLRLMPNQSDINPYLKQSDVQRHC